MSWAPIIEQDSSQIRCLSVGCSARNFKIRQVFSKLCAQMLKYQPLRKFIRNPLHVLSSYEVKNRGRRKSCVSLVDGLCVLSRSQERGEGGVQSFFTSAPQTQTFPLKRGHPHRQTENTSPLFLQGGATGYEPEFRDLPLRNGQEN